MSQTVNDVSSEAWEENRARKAVDLRLAREAALLTNMKEVQTDGRRLAREYNRRMIFDKQDGDLRRNEDEDAMGDINVGDNINHYYPAQATPVASVIPTATAVSPAVPSGLPGWLKTGAIVAASVATGGGAAALIPMALSWFTSKPAATAPNYTAPNWEMEIVPQPKDAGT